MQTAGSGPGSPSTGIFALLRQSRVVIRGISVEIEKPSGDQPGKVRKVRDNSLTPGVAHVYNEGVLHSPRREGDTRLIRVEGQNLKGVKRDKYEVAA